MTQVRTVERDGYEAVQLAFEDCKDKHITKPELGHLKKAGLKHGKRHLVEFAAPATSRSATPSPSRPSRRARR